ncbi:DUF4199 domain-containing protein [Flavobacterium paronense]|uniref:DUF4199 domain-containing protein n=1 Tax=Flavobacterium paronense TaxID=1392775 RepID=A0ABV5GCE6_9FLAO
MNEIIKKNALTFGFIIGLFSVLTTTLIYIIDLELFTKWWIGIITISFSIAIGCYLVIKTKKEMGTISFKETFSVYFIAASIGYLISNLFNYLLFNFIDPEAKEKIKEIVIKYTVDILEKVGSPKSAINETIQKMNETDSYSIGNLLFGYAFSLVIIAIFGLILAAIFKSKPSQGL